MDQAQPETPEEDPERSSVTHRRLPSFQQANTVGVIVGALFVLGVAFHWSTSESLGGVSYRLRDTSLVLLGERYFDPLFGAVVALLLRSYMGGLGFWRGVCTMAGTAFILFVLRDRTIDFLAITGQIKPEMYFPPLGGGMFELTAQYQLSEAYKTDPVFAVVFYLFVTILVTLLALGLMLFGLRPKRKDGAGTKTQGWGVANIGEPLWFLLVGVSCLVLVVAWWSQ
jgi:hypothetical protein